MSCPVSRVPCPMGHDTCPVSHVPCPNLNFRPCVGLILYKIKCICFGRPHINIYIYIFVYGTGY